MSAAGMALGLASAYAAGALLAWRLWPEREKPALLLAALAWPAGMALTSQAYFAWLLASGGRAAWYPGLEFAALLAAAAALVRSKRARGERLRLPARPSGAALVALGLLAVVVLASLPVVLRYAEVTPWGYWDAWARIDLKARFLHAGGPAWTWIFHGDGVPHRDYPLGLECSLARLWCFSGGVAPLPAQVLSVLNWVGCVAALLALVGHLGSPFLAAVAGLALACHRSDLGWVAMQYADFALASAFTWGAGILVLAARSERREAFGPLLGCSAGAAAWCKDEGLVFAALVLVLAAAACLAAPARRGRAAAGLGLGVLLGGGAATGFVKLGLGGASELLGARERSVLADLTDPARYRTVGGHFLAHVTSDVAGWALAALGLAVFLLPRAHAVRRSWLPLGLSAVLALAFLLVLVTTREDLDWHVTTTIDRLVLQLWPLSILGAVTALGRTDTSSLPPHKALPDPCSSAS